MPLFTLNHAKTKNDQSQTKKASQKAPFQKHAYDHAQAKRY